MSFLRPASVQRAVRFGIRYSTPAVILQYLQNGSINPIDYLIDTLDTVEDAEIEIPPETPTFDVQSVTISIPPQTILDVGTSAEVQQSPEYQLIRSSPRPDVPQPSNLRTTAPVTRFNQTIATSLAESIKERKFGCLLHEPIRKDPVKIKECKVEELSQEEQDNILLNFALWLTRNVGDPLLNTILPRACDLSIVAKTVLSGGGTGTILTFIGCKILKYYILNEIASNLTTLSIGVQSTVPSDIEFEECDPLPTDDSGNDFDICPPQQDLDTCFVPIRNLRSNLPGGEGYKTQLQIVFSDSPTALNDLRQLTVPSPINPEDITRDLILEALYGFIPEDNTLPFKFGQVKYEIDVTPYGYLRYYGQYEERPYQLTKDLFQRISDLLINGSIDLDSFRPSDRSRTFSELDLYPVKALLFDFSNPGNAKCTRWDLRKKDPT